MSQLSEFSKMAFRLLDEINQQVIDCHDVGDLSDISERIATCVAGLSGGLREHDRIAGAEHKPERYSQMCEARPMADCETSLDAFFADVKAARLHHQIADVHLITRVILKTKDGETPAMGFAHFGSVQEAEGMCAWAMGRAAEKRREAIANLTEQGKKGARQ